MSNQPNNHKPINPQFVVKRISHGPKHHLFGFHDLVQTNAKGDFALSLEVDDISHPPLLGETCAAGVIDLKTGGFRKLHDTHTWNYPQGARQQWIGDSDLCVCNDRAEDGNLISVLSDARSLRVIDQFPFPVHCIQSEKQLAFFQDFNRLYAVGGYGYVGGNQPSRLIDIPENDGLWIGDLKTKKVDLLLSVRKIAECGERRPVKTGYPHYVTHGMLNPQGTRIAFLHQYRVPDGGDISRILTCDLDGQNLRCLGKGLISHYTWVDNETIFAFGEDQRALSALREAAWLRIPGILQSMVLAKKIVRTMRALKSVKNENNGNTDQKASHYVSKSFMLIRDCESAERKRIALGVLTEDGHPMANPKRHHLLVNDTYPNKAGNRTLMLYDVDNNIRTEIGLFRRLFKEPDPKTFDAQLSMKGVDPRICAKFPRRDYLFTRSGYHADLHPRWSFDGKTVFFDSIHEGTRQVYAVEVEGCFQ